MSPVSYRLRSMSVLIAGFAVGLALTACGSGDGAAEAPATGSSATSPSKGTDAVAWVDGFCGAIKGFVTDQDNLPVPSEGDTVEAIQRATSTQLGGFVAVLDKAIAALAALPEAPDSITETAARTATDNYTAARETAATAKTELDAAAPDDVEAQNRAVDGLIAAQEQAHKSLDPVAPLVGSPELKEAAAKAPKCS